MRVLVINPPNKPFTNKSIMAEPLDVLQIATVINQRFNDVEVIDMDVERINDINNYLIDKNVVVFVYDYQLPLHTSEAIDNIFEIINKTNKETKFIVIGKTSSYFYEKFLNNGIDAVIKGIAENIICDVIESIYDVKKLKEMPNIIFKDNGNIIINPYERRKNDFKSLPIPNREFVNITKYMDTRTIITSRGCIGTCKFCTTPYYFGNWNSKKVEDVINEIELLIKNYHTKKIIFLDDNALVDKNRMLEICHEIKKRNIKCLFGALCSIKCYDKEVLEKMYEVGFRWIHFGIESGSPRILKLMNKEMDIEYIKRVINETKNIGYRVRTSFILDYPNSTKEDILKTKDLILSIMPDELRLHYLAYRVSTPVYDENKNVLNKSQYIHSNKPNIENIEITNEIDNLLEELKLNGYNIITNDIDWNIYEECNKDTKVAAFTPIKYGMCWYE